MEQVRTVTVEHVVTPADTAAAVGSGDLPVLGTPRLLAWCEGATCAALAGDLDAGQTSVGVRVELDHLAASAVGERVAVTATLDAVDGRRRGCVVAATQTGPDGIPEEIARGRVERVVVDVERFLARLS